MSDFHKIQVKKILRQTPSCVEIQLDIPENLQSQFQFEPGQYLTFQYMHDGEDLRRNYSICSVPSDTGISVAVKEIEGGRFSTYANQKLKAGDMLSVTYPDGGFKVHQMDSSSYLFIAAGSGITPIISMIKNLLQVNPNANVNLLYGNQNTVNIIFREELEDLKNLYMERLNVTYILSKEQSDSELNNGRINPEKVKSLWGKSIRKEELEGIYLCGPSQMIMELKDYLVNDEKFSTEKIHFELFNTDGLSTDSNYAQTLENNKALRDKMCKVTVEVDGRTYIMDLQYGGDTILDAATKSGADLPYACKGGVCCTCRAKLIQGEVDMEKNYALEPDEIANGYILTCQSHPKSDEVVISFDYK